MYHVTVNQILGKVKWYHIWLQRFQFRSIFNKHHELRQNICTNAKDTARQWGQILSVLIFLLCKQSNQNNNWEFAHTALLCSWRSYRFPVQVRGVCWKWNEIEIDYAINEWYCLPQLSWNHFFKKFLFCKIEKFVKTLI